VSTVPVAWLVAFWGWRPTFLAAALMLLGCAAFLWYGLPRDEEAASRQPSQASEGYRAVFTNPFLLRAVPSLIMFQGGFLALQTLWAGPWMTQVLALSTGAAARALMALNAALLASFLVLGWIAPRIAARGWDGPRVMRAAALLTLITESAIVLSLAEQAWILWLVLAATSTVFTLLQTEVALSFPQGLGGRAYTGLNMLLFGGAFALQWGFGAVIDLATSLGETTTGAYQRAMLVLIMLQLASLIPLRSRVPHQLPHQTPDTGRTRTLRWQNAVPVQAGCSRRPRKGRWQGCAGSGWLRRNRAPGPHSNHEARPRAPRHRDPWWQRPAQRRLSWLATGYGCSAAQGRACRAVR